MITQKIKIEEKQADFVKNYAQYGFQTSDEMIRKALNLLYEKLEYAHLLETSAALYAELYDNDAEAQEWVEAASEDWK